MNVFKKVYEKSWEPAFEMRYHTYDGLERIPKQQTNKDAMKKLREIKGMENKSRT